MTPLEDYLRALCAIRSSGAAVNETSYYDPLANLFNEVGKTLKPRVRCIMNLRNRGAGMPDGGFFTADQFERSTSTEPFPGQIPSRGVVEAKGTAEDVRRIAQSEQVRRYLGRYHLVLVTDYRDFLLLAEDEEGQHMVLETYSLAASEAEFWSTPIRRLANTHAERFTDYLRRVMLHAAPLATPQDVAWFLASYAREARARLELSELPAMAAVRTALEEALGIEFRGKKGEHFFRSTLVQTLFYGVFASWVLWCKQRGPISAHGRFDWHLAAYGLRLPILRKLYHELAEPGQLERLQLAETLDWAETVLNRVDRKAFFARFEERHAVQYFYEPFLQAFDPELRKELGVWYTPSEVVQYMVARVDTVVRQELGLEDGLADERVYVLDPCCGTGAYLAEVLQCIATTLRAKGENGLLSHDLKRAAMRRVVGFEILPAPFVIAHLQLGLLLQGLGVPLAENERAAVYLTNALTGWADHKEATQLAFPEMQQEREAAERVKQRDPILVVLGNPPYNSFAGMAIGEERELTEAYRTTRLAPAPAGQGLNDLYVRFFRMAERKIVEGMGQGAVCLISNYSWLDGLSFTGMRERYLEVFDGIWIDCLNGDKYRTGKLTPEGEPDPSVFSTDFNREGIQVGTAVTLMVRKRQHEKMRVVRFRHLWGRRKRTELLESAAQDGVSLYQMVTPALALGLPFVPTRVYAAYFAWPLLTEIFPMCFPGVKTSRDDLVVDVDRDKLVQRMRLYFDPAVSHDALRQVAPCALASTARFNARVVREQLCKRGFLPDHVVRYCYRPFDMRWIYWEPVGKLLDEKRSEYFPQIFERNVWIEARQKQTLECFDRGYVVRVLADNFGNGLSSFFPLYLVPGQQGSLLVNGAGSAIPNISNRATMYLALLGISPDELFYHSVAILHSPEYRAENSNALRQGWPRIPLAATAEALHASAALGRQVAALLDSPSPVNAVTSGALRPELRVIGGICALGGRALNPDGGDLDLSAGWGHAGKNGATMPGKGRWLQRAYSAEELASMREGAQALGLDLDAALRCLGEATCDVYLNDVVYWRNVPRRIWEYTISGYQVIKKWLSYREKSLLGRGLLQEEAREVTHIARRIAALVLLQPALDKNYCAVKDTAYAWQADSTPPALQQAE